MTLVSLGLFQVIGRSDAEGLNQLRGNGGNILIGNDLTQSVDVACRLMSMQLDIVETIAPADVDNLLRSLIDKDPHTFGITGQIVWSFTDITARLGPEDQSEPVDAQGFDVADVLGLTHATYLDY